MSPLIFFFLSNLFFRFSKAFISLRWISIWVSYWSQISSDILFSRCSKGFFIEVYSTVFIWKGQEFNEPSLSSLFNSNIVLLFLAFSFLFRIFLFASFTFWISFLRAMMLFFFLLFILQLLYLYYEEVLLLYLLIFFAYQLVLD